MVVHTSDFIPSGYRTNFNGFEGMSDTVHHPNLYSEDGIRVEQINGDNDIWGSYAGFVEGSAHEGYEGSGAWYPGGGDNGFTQITRSDGSDFTNVGFLNGSGAYRETFRVILMYELYNDGVLVLSGSFSYWEQIPSFPARLFPQVVYLGFSGGGFDEILVRNGLTRTSPIYDLVTSFHDGTNNSLAIDSIELSNVVPEPSSFVLAALGLIGLVV